KAAGWDLQMFNVMLKRARRAPKSESGAVLVIFLALIIPLIILLAVAIDFSQFLVMKRQLASAVDAAALRLGATSTALTEAQMSAEAEAFVLANYPAGKAIGKLGPIQVIPIDKNTVQVTASATLNTAFLKLAGYNTLGVTVSAQSTRNEKYLEIVLVLDNTG